MVACLRPVPGVAVPFSDSESPFGGFSGRGQASMTINCWFDSGFDTVESVSTLGG